MDYSEDAPLLQEDGHSRTYTEGSGVNGNEESVDSRKNTYGASGATVKCRVCDSLIELEGKNTQHVVKCGQCQEATPIRPAPTGKKYVRCPCNCLLICKAASTRIACPRSNCRRVITLGHREPQGSAVRAPTGSCRVSCVHCREVFLFNTLNNSLAKCPHCKKNSSIGGFAQRRAMWYLAGAVLLMLLSVLVTVISSAKASSVPIIYLGYLILYGATGVLIVQFVKHWMIKMSTVIGPI